MEAKVALPVCLSESALRACCTISGEERVLLYVLPSVLFCRKLSHSITNVKCASAGSRTRIDCLEGNHANRYTTDAMDANRTRQTISNVMIREVCAEKSVRRPGVEPGSTAWKATMLTVTPPTLQLVDDLE